MSCSHSEVVTRYREDLGRPRSQRLGEFTCSCGAHLDREQARSLHFAGLEADKHTSRDTGGVYPGDLEPLAEGDDGEGGGGDREAPPRRPGRTPRDGRA